MMDHSLEWNENSSIPPILLRETSFHIVKDIPQLNRFSST